VRHRLGGNWVKVYDKASVLRVETTINKPSEFRALRVFTDFKDRRERRWCPMRKGVADFSRNYQVGVAALDALCRPHTKAGRSYPRLNPLTPIDLALFRALLAGEHAINGWSPRCHAHGAIASPTTATASSPPP
jgi:hypothetical protein